MKKNGVSKNSRPFRCILSVHFLNQGRKRHGPSDQCLCSLQSQANLQQVEKEQERETFAANIEKLSFYRLVSSCADKRK